MERELFVRKVCLILISAWGVGCWDPLSDSNAEEADRLDVVGDLDRDGVCDLVFSTATVLWPDEEDSSSEWVLVSGRLGTVIRRISSESPTLFGSMGSKRLGDVDRDGIDDIAIASLCLGKGVRGRVEALSGVDLEPLWQREFTDVSWDVEQEDWGRTYIQVGVVDGRAAVIVAGDSRDYPDSQRLVVFDAASGQEVNSHSYSTWSDPEICVLACGPDSRVWLLDARSTQSDANGLSVSFLSDESNDPDSWIDRARAVGDLDADGCEDMLVCGSARSAYGRIVSGTSGENLLNLQYEPTWGYAKCGSSPMRLGDTVGVAVLLSGHQVLAGGKVVFHSLSDGAVLRELSAPSNAVGFADCGVDVEDFSGDGVDEYVVSYFARMPPYERLICYSGETVLWQCTVGR